MCLSLEVQNLCSIIVSDHKQSNIAMHLLSPHEQIYFDDRC